MATRFHEQLAAYLRRANTSGTAFAERVGVSQSTMSRIQLGARPPDLSQLDAWAKALGLAGEERRAFVLAGQLAHCPIEVVELIGKLTASIEALEQREKELEATLERIMARFAPGAPQAPAPKSTKR